MPTGNVSMRRSPPSALARRFRAGDWGAHPGPGQLRHATSHAVEVLPRTLRASASSGPRNVRPSRVSTS
jgi:hypothetical protein